MFHSLFTVYFTQIYFIYCIFFTLMVQLNKFLSVYDNMYHTFFLQMFILHTHPEGSYETYKNRPCHSGFLRCHDRRSLRLPWLYL